MIIINIIEQYLPSRKMGLEEVSFKAHIWKDIFPGDQYGCSKHTVQ